LKSNPNGEKQFWKDGLDRSLQLGVQIDYDVVHLRTSLVQLFVLLQLNFEEVVQIIELRRFGGAPNGYPFAALSGLYQPVCFFSWY
jgi:hypothetical protein